ncbi:MAG: M16 family metallopeptidase [Candidatus Dormibacteria bacterium]
MTDAVPAGGGAQALPVPGPVPPLRVGRVARARLGNGVEVMVVPHPSVPRVELRLTVPAGAAIGVSAAAAELLRAGMVLGTRELDQEQLSEQIQNLGGSLQVHQDQDRLQISAAALAEAEEDLYRLLGQLVAAPYFPAPELEIEKVKLIEGLRMARATPQFPAIERLQQLLYGRHPYGRREPSEAAVARVNREQLRQLHGRSFAPGATQITVVGQVEPRRTQRWLERFFGQRRGATHPPALPALRRPGPTAGVSFIDRPGSVQTVILAGVSAPPQGHPDHLPLSLAAAVLGGSFSCRLMANLREDKGYTYGAHARAHGHLLDTMLAVESEVRTEVTAAAYAEMSYELARLSTVEVGREELERTRTYMSGARLVMLQTQAGLAGALAQLRAQGLDHRYLEQYAKRLGRVSAAELRRAAARYLAPTALTTVMVGDARQALAGLRPLAAVRRTRA